jgi:hypothetical protein
VRLRSAALQETPTTPVTSDEDEDEDLKDNDEIRVQDSLRASLMSLVCLGIPSSLRLLWQADLLSIPSPTSPAAPAV